MLRPRRAKQRPVQSHEIVGLLPSEEAAIQKALMASIAKPSKTSPSQGQTSSPKFPRTVPKKFMPPNQKSTRARSTTPKSVSMSPLSLTSNVSFLSTSSDSFSWTPTCNPPKVKGRKKAADKSTTDRKISPKQSKVRTVSAVQKEKTSPKLSTSKEVGGLKSLHKETLQAKKAKLIACAVRKKANMAAEPRNKDGLTVDEILMSLANPSKLKVSEKSKSPKVKSHAKKPPSFPQIPKQSNKSNVQSSPTKVTPTLSPEKVSKSPPNQLFTPNRYLTLEVTPIPVTATSASQDGSSQVSQGPKSEVLPAESAIQERRESTLSPNSYSYQAQRKFASNHSPPQSANQNVASPQGLKETPKTEDFLHFLCLRGSKSIPEQYKKFELPWTPVKPAPDKPTTKKVNRDKSAVGCGLTAKKLDFMSG